MNMHSRIAPNHASATNAESCVKSFGRCAYRAVMRSAQSYFKRENRSAAKELVLASGHPLRTVQTWFADRHQGSASALIALLLTDAAPDVLRTIRAEAEAAGIPIPDFYDDLEMIGEVANAMRRQQQNTKQRALSRKRHEE